MLLTNNPSNDSMNLHSTSADLGQVKLDLEHPGSSVTDTMVDIGSRKKSSSAMLAGEEDMVVKKTSKSSDDGGATGASGAGANEVFDSANAAPLSCKENQGGGGGAEGGGDGENGCWISNSQEQVCPWEDE